MAPRAPTAPLAAAIAKHGPTPCQTSLEPEAWWTPETAAAAIADCRRCPVAGECLAYAIANDERWGVWGAVCFEPRLSRLLPA